jgi:predicted ATPase/class 3 adenylate cyclase
VQPVFWDRLETAAQAAAHPVDGGSVCQAWAVSEHAGGPGVLPSGTVTFLFTDVEGSTRLWAADKDAMSASLLVHDAILRAAIERNGGYVFTTAGDSFAAAFGRASAAVRAATEAQLALSGGSWPGPPLRVRMGLHLGEAEERGGDYFGPVVNTAARVEAAGHGGQVLITDAVRAAAVLTDVADLGVRHLRDVAEPLRLFQLGTDTFPPLRVVDPVLSNLPARPTELIGREAELARIRGLLGDSRLVTVTAVGGSGKTRLAIAVGEAELPHVPDGVWFVDLTAVSSDAEVVQAIANGLGLNLLAGDPSAQVLGFLADRRALVILDNCEHLIDACAGFVESFLATSSPARLLATSREAFDIDGERVVVLGPLATDTVDSPGVRLFVDRASAVFPEFVLSDANAATVSAICSRLDGMPLAIELAAARVTVMNPDELLAGLDDRFQLLSGGRRRSRQRTLEATLDWSYDLLDPDEQRVFRALGVFIDGFDLDAVAAVTGLDRRTTTRHIEALRAKSLVVRADKRKATRFRLLETVKAYAEDRLVDASEAVAARDRHLAHYHQLAMTEGRKVWGSLDVGLRLRHDCPNIVAAFEWACDHDRWIIAGELLTGSQCAFHLDLRMTELVTALERMAPNVAELDADVHGCVTTQIWYLSIVLADIPLAIAAARALRHSSLGEFRSIGWSTAAFVMEFADLGSADGLLARAEREWNTPEPSVTVLSDAHAVAGLIMMVPHQTVAFLQGDFERSRDLSHEMARLSRTSILSESVQAAAMSEVLLGQPVTALATVAQLDEFEFPFNDGTQVRALAHLALGDADTATSYIRGMAVRAATGAFPAESNDAMFLLAALSHHEGDDDAARRLVFSAGDGRTPSSKGFSRHFAKQLGIIDEYAADVAALYKPDNPHGPMGTTRSLNALRAELARRGWS